MSQTGSIKLNPRNFSLSLLVSSIVGMAMSCCYAQSPASAAKSDAAGHGACNYACLVGFTNRYMDALVHKDPSRIPLAPDRQVHQKQRPDADWRRRDLGHDRVPSRRMP